MAVVKMDKINIAAIKNQESDILAFLQRQEIVEISQQDLTSDIYSATNQNDLIQFCQKQFDKSVEAEKILSTSIGEKVSIVDSLKGRQVSSEKEYCDFESKEEEISNDVDLILSLSEKISEAETELIKISTRETQISPWLNVPVPLTYTGTKNTLSYIGFLPNVSTSSDINNSIAEIDPSLETFHIDIVSKTKENTVIIATIHRDIKLEFEKVLSELQFVYPIYSTHKIPRVALENLEIQRQKFNSEIESLSDKINNLGYRLEDVKFLIDYLAVNLEQLKASNKLAKSNYTFILDGYIISDAGPIIKEKLEEKFDCVVDIRSTNDEDDPPIQLKNSWFSEPCESVVASYGYPQYKEIDPTSVTSIFYYIMFGLMFSDAGYGFVLATACGILLLKFKNMRRATNKFLRLFFWCGLSTVFWGIIFSSYFGDVVDVVSANFFGKTLSIPPIWFSPLDNPMKLLIFCLAIGIVHLVTGYLVNAYVSLKNKDYSAIIYDALFQIAFLFSLLIIFISTDMFRGMSGFAISITPMAQNICLGIAAVCGVGIILTGGRESTNWFKRLLKGAFAFYNVMAGWVSDILSYSRLLALGLATGVIASVVNMLGAMLGKGIVAAIGFIIIFIAGHAMNFGINILGSYVHSNRLEYVEFFGKFFEGGGRRFAPLRIDTKYYNFKEDINNG